MSASARWDGFSGALILWTVLGLLAVLLILVGLAFEALSLTWDADVSPALAGVSLVLLAYLLVALAWGLQVLARYRSRPRPYKRHRVLEQELTGLIETYRCDLDVYRVKVKLIDDEKTRERLSRRLDGLERLLVPDEDQAAPRDGRDRRWGDASSQVANHQYLAAFRSIYRYERGLITLAKALDDAGAEPERSYLTEIVDQYRDQAVQYPDRDGRRRLVNLLRISSDDPGATGSISPYLRAARRLHRYYEERLAEQLKMKRLLGRLLGVFGFLFGLAVTVPIALVVLVVLAPTLLVNSGVAPTLGTELVAFVGDVASVVGPTVDSGVPTFDTPTGETVTVVQNGTVREFDGATGPGGRTAVVVSPTPSTLASTAARLLWFPVAAALGVLGATMNLVWRSGSEAGFFDVNLELGRLTVPDDVLLEEFVRVRLLWGGIAAVLLTLFLGLQENTQLPASLLFLTAFFAGFSEQFLKEGLDKFQKSTLERVETRVRLPDDDQCTPPPE